MTRVSIVDYGTGNLLSARRAFEVCGAAVEMAVNPDQIRSAERLVLPGVGAFGDCVNALSACGLVDALLGYCRTGRPLIGICVGMQMLFDLSEEFGEHAGLGLIPGRVRKIPATADGKLVRKVPHIGWTRLQQANGDWSLGLLKGIAPGDSVYFVHSYTAWPDDPFHRIADATHDGTLISAVVGAGNVYGTQFHPEKSGPVGLRIIENFLAC